MSPVELLLLPPVLRAFIATAIAGAVFPLAGIAIVELKLLPMRFMLMHGAILGGVLALIFDATPVAGAIVTNIVLLVLMAVLGRITASRFDLSAMFMMVVTLALAVMLLSLYDLPAQVAVSLLWGNPFAATPGEVWALVVYAIAALGGSFVFRRSFVVYLFDRDVALTLGVSRSLIEYGIVAAVALTVSLGVRLLGALLLDGLVLLPALTALSFGRSARGSAVAAVTIGVASAVLGFLFALLVDVPVSTGVVFAAILMLGVRYAFKLLFR